MIKLIVLVVALVILAILILASFKPDSFRVERSATILAPPEKVFAYINDLHSWAAWSPWEKLDPNLKRTYSANTIGTGASYEWQGNRKVGRGRMTIGESVAPSSIVIKLDFFVPMRAHNTAEFTLAAYGNGTFVTWAMYGPSSYLARLFHVFLNMDKMVGRDFEDGLVNLKALAEK